MNFLNNILLIILILNIVLALIMIFFERKNPTTTWAWLLVLILLPIIGFLLYLFLGQNIHKEKIFDIKYGEDILHQRLLDKRNTINEINHSKDEDVAKCKEMVLMHYKYSHSVLTQNNKIDIYTNGEEKFKYLLQDIKNAKYHIHMLYYIYKPDNIGDKILKNLIKKAQQGVEVRLLYDAMGGKSISKHYFDELKKAGGKVAIFFPSILPHFNIRINYRNHRKIVVIDGKIGYTGGMNIGDEYLGISKKFGYWRDTHLRIEGNAVDGLQKRFLLDWRYAAHEKIEFSTKYFPQKNTNGNTPIQIVTCGPDNIEEEIKNGYLKMIFSAKKYIYIQSPYFVPDSSVIDALKIAALSGVDVRIMIPSKPDHPFVYWCTYSYIGELIQTGVKCYKYNKGFLHAKTIVVDRLVSSAGTANMDIRSYKLNFEVNAFIYDHIIAEKFEKIFIKDIENSIEITSQIYDKRSYLIRFKESISRLLSPIL